MAERLPALSAADRERLLEQARRLNREPPLSGIEATGSSRDPAWSPRWRRFLPWIGALAALLPLVIIVFFPAPRSTQHASVAPRDTLALRGAPPSSPAPIPSMPVALENNPVSVRPTPAKPRDAIGGPPPGLGFAPSLSRFAPPSATSPVATASNSAEPPAAIAPKIVGRTGAVEIPNRQHFKVEPDTGRPPALLSDFDVLRSGSSVELRESDGSRYLGRVSPVRLGNSGPDWTLEARGRSVTLGLPVLITGNFGAPISPDDESSRFGVQRGGGKWTGAPAASVIDLDRPLSMTVMVGGTNVIELQAVPAAGTRGLQ